MIPKHARSSSERMIGWLVNKGYIPYIGKDDKIFFNPPDCDNSPLCQDVEEIIVEENPSGGGIIPEKKPQTREPSTSSIKRQEETSFTQTADEAIDYLTDVKIESIKQERIKQLFEQFLDEIKTKAATQKIEKQSCFICFNFDEVDIRDWVAQHLMIDLKRAGLKVLCSRKIPFGGDINYFQLGAYSANKVVLVCSEDGQKKVQARLNGKHPIYKGLAAEIQALLNYLQSHSSRINRW
jgi:hypothetical protein